MKNDDLNIEKSLTSTQVKTNNSSYILAIILMFMIGIVGVISVSIFQPKQDLVIIIAAVFGFLTPTTASILSLMKAQETHLSVNSRLDEFIRNAEAVARFEGAAEGAKDANIRTDQLKKESDKVTNM